MVQIDEAKIKDYLSTVAVKVADVFYVKQSLINEYKHQGLGMIIMCDSMGLVKASEFEVLADFEIKNATPGDFTGAYADGKIDCEKVKSQIFDIALELAKYSSESTPEIDALTYQGLGMMLMCIELDIMTRSEMNVLIEYAINGVANADFYDAFIDGTYAHVPTMDNFSNPFTDGRF